MFHLAASCQRMYYMRYEQSSVCDTGFESFALGVLRAGRDLFLRLVGGPASWHGHRGEYAMVSLREKTE